MNNDNLDKTKIDNLDKTKIDNLDNQNKEQEFINNKKKQITSVFINKIIEEFNKNEKNINHNIVKPLLNKIYNNIYHYLYFLLILIIILILLNLTSILIFTYYIKKIRNNIFDLKENFKLK
jgi:predicted PurR-regulated permease PerM